MQGLEETFPKMNFFLFFRTRRVSILVFDHLLFRNKKWQQRQCRYCHYLFRKTGQDMSKKWVSIFDFSLQKNKWKSFVFDLDRKQFRIVDSKLCAPCHWRGRECLWRETSPGHGRNPARLCLCARNPLFRSAGAARPTSYKYCWCCSARRARWWPHSWWAVLAVHATSKMSSSWCSTRASVQVLFQACVVCVFYCHLKTYCGPCSETMQSPE